MSPFPRICPGKSPFIAPSRKLGRVIRRDVERSTSRWEIVDNFHWVDCLKVNHRLTKRLLVGFDVNDFPHVYLIAVKTNLIESHVFSQLLQASGRKEKRGIFVIR